VRDEDLDWNGPGVRVRVVTTRAGTGPTLLLLPALSSVSTRAEMRPLQTLLARSFATLASDWPGFGELARPRADWRPETYAAFLAHIASMEPRPHATIGAGHACGYVLAQAAAQPGSLGSLCLIAPTWRGPLPTMLGRRHPALPVVARAVDLPILGALLYRLNVNRVTLAMMSRGHVYATPGGLDAARMAAKRKVTDAAGARHASIRFVAGELDPVRSRDAFLALAANVRDPVLVVFGAGTPRKSLAEMEALASLPNVTAVRLPAGKLAVHEEFPAQVFAAIAPFLGTRNAAP
jgi:pimeloyl-ACP methyl ester carboxylesterase